MPPGVKHEKHGRKGGDWKPYIAQVIFILKSYVGFFTFCRTGEVILDYLEVHVNFYVC